MCFGSGAPSYTKKDYGPLPSLGTGRTDETPLGLTAPAAPVTRGGSSSTADEAMARARASYNSSSSRPVARPSGLNTTPSYTPPKKNSLLRETYLNVTSPFMRG